MRRARRSLGLALWVLGFAATPSHAFWRFAQNWRDYSPGERYEALQNYERHRNQPEKRQKRIEQRYQRFQQMPEQERARIRENYERFRKLPPNQQREFEDRYKTWKKGSQPPPPPPPPPHPR